VSRWLSRTRELILEETRRTLEAELQLSGPELDSVLGLARSLDVSLRTLLASREPDSAS